MDFLVKNYADYMNKHNWKSNAGFALHFIYLPTSSKSKEWDFYPAEYQNFLRWSDYIVLPEISENFWGCSKEFQSTEILQCVWNQLKKSGQKKGLTPFHAGKPSINFTDKSFSSLWKVFTSSSAMCGPWLKQCSLDLGQSVNLPANRKLELPV